MSTLILPSSCKKVKPSIPEKKKEAEPIVVDRNKFSYADLIDGMEAAPGRVVLDPFTGFFRSAGGLIIVQGEIDMAGTIDNAWYGWVLSCGPSCKRDGTPVDYPNYPLPIGTLVEHTCQRPFRGPDGLSIINCAEITRSWAPGVYPKWWPEEHRRPT